MFVLSLSGIVSEFHHTSKKPKILHSKSAAIRCIEGSDIISLETLTSSVTVI